MDLTNIQSLTAEQRQALETLVKEEAWRRGDLEWKLDATQIRVRRAREAAWAPAPPLPPGTVLSEVERVRRVAIPISFYELLARGNGKSFELTCYAVETALKKPNQRILYCAPLRADAEKIVKDLLDLNILLDCPEDVRPEWKAGEGEYHFKNGSTIRFRGVNNESDDRLRGAGYHLVILDEVGTYDRLRKTLGIVQPVAKRFKGKLILATTPSEQEDHESTQVYEEHAVSVTGRPPAAIKLTMLDNPRWTWEERVQILADSGEALEDIPAILERRALPKRTVTLREYWCEFTTDEARARFPEFRTALLEVVVPHIHRPEFFYPYTVFDLGFVDRTGGLYGEHFYEEDLLVIEDESLLVRPSSRDIADEVNGKESTLWGKPPHPVTRVMDAAPFTLEDIRREHRLDFQPPDKSGIQSNVSYVQGANNYANLIIAGRQVRIHERCVNLIRQLTNAVWNKNRNDFERDTRTGPDSMGHYDLAAAFVYFCRAVDRRRNPFPPGWRTKKDGPDVWRRREEKSTGLMPKTSLFRALAQRRPWTPGR